MRILPIKLKRHVLNLLRFAMAYGVIAIGAEIGQGYGAFEHYTLIRWGLDAAYFLIAGWFCWRFYTGMVPDCDFYDEF